MSPTHDFDNIGDVLDFDIVKGVIVSIDDSVDTCVVSVAGSHMDALLFYHCEPGSILRDNGAIEGAAAAFKEGDEVIVLVKKDREVVKVIGHTDGARHCVAPLLVITIHNWDTGRDTRQYVIVWDIENNKLCDEIFTKDDPPVQLTFPCQVTSWRPEYQTAEQQRNYGLIIDFLRARCGGKEAEVLYSSPFTLNIPTPPPVPMLPSAPEVHYPSVIYPIWLQAQTTLIGEISTGKNGAEITTGDIYMRGSPMIPILSYTNTVKGTMTGDVYTLEADHEYLSRNAEAYHLSVTKYSIIQMQFFSYFSEHQAGAVVMNEDRTSWVKILDEAHEHEMWHGGFETRVNFYYNKEGILSNGSYNLSDLPSAPGSLTTAIAEVYAAFYDLLLNRCSDWAVPDWGMFGDNRRYYPDIPMPHPGVYVWGAPHVESFQAHVTVGLCGIS